MEGEYKPSPGYLRTPLPITDQRLRAKEGRRKARITQRQVLPGAQSLPGPQSLHGLANCCRAAAPQVCVPLLPGEALTE